MNQNVPAPASEPPEDLSHLVLTLQGLRTAAALPRKSGPFVQWLAQRNIPGSSAMNRAELEAAIAWIESGLRQKDQEWIAAVGAATAAIRTTRGVPQFSTWDCLEAQMFRADHPRPTADDFLNFAKELRQCVPQPPAPPAPPSTAA